jgi:hypothetical protein
MPPVLGPRVTVVAGLVVLRGGKGHRVGAVAQADEARFLAARNSSTTTVAPALPKALPDSMPRTAASASASFLRHHHPLAGSQAVRLDHDGRALAADVGFRSSEIGKGR